ncbi:hypothetical protein ONS96_013341 [Cadophora gregata f. sp. sojae]|nr:hypothetical protein ONS96_013341 [Cadophora gregata f. sp. sojae]
MYQGCCTTEDVRCYVDEGASGSKNSKRGSKADTPSDRRGGFRTESKATPNDATQKRTRFTSPVANQQPCPEPRMDGISVQNDREPLDSSSAGDFPTVHSPADRPDLSVMNEPSSLGSSNAEECVIKKTARTGKDQTRMAMSLWPHHSGRFFRVETRRNVSIEASFVSTRGTAVKRVYQKIHRSSLKILQEDGNTGQLNFSLCWNVRYNDFKHRNDILAC